MLVARSRERLTNDCLRVDESRRREILEHLRRGGRDRQRRSLSRLGGKERLVLVRRSFERGEVGLPSNTVPCKECALDSTIDRSEFARKPLPQTRIKKVKAVKVRTETTASRDPKRFSLCTLPDPVEEGLTSRIDYVPNEGSSELVLESAGFATIET